jgi:hypothetical protein
MALPQKLPEALPDSETTAPDSKPFDAVEHQQDERWPPLFHDVPLTEDEKRVYGSDAERCEETGFIFERGSGALTRPQQTKLFKERLCNPVWVREYFRSDPNAARRYPKLERHYRELGVWND